MLDKTRGGGVVLHNNLVTWFGFDVEPPPPVLHSSLTWGLRRTLRGGHLTVMSYALQIVSFVQTKTFSFALLFFRRKQGPI